MKGFNISMTAATSDFGNLASLAYLEMAGDAKAFRYPGGTVANYWDWENETLDEVTALEHDKLVKHIKHQKNVNNGELIKLSFSSFRELCEIKKASPVIVLPVYNKSADYCIELIDRLEIGNAYWEIGNELHLPRYKTNLDEYIAKCSRIIGHIKQNYPSDKVAAVAWGFDEFRGTINPKVQEWNTAINGLDCDVTIHPYIYYSDSVYEDVVNFPGIMKRNMLKDFPNKRLWITEVSIMKIGHTWERSYLLNLYYKGLQSINPEMILFHYLGDGNGDTASHNKDFTMNANSAVYDLL